MNKKFLALPLLVALLAGCNSTITKTEQYSGFLGDYSKLQETKSESGVPVLRWTSEKFQLMRYQNVQLQPVFFYPQPTPSAQVNSQVLTEIAQYVDKQLRAELGKTVQLTNQPGPNTLVMKVAITGVGTEAEGLKPYEVIPIALVAAAASGASGARDRVATVYLEMEARDARSNTLMGQAVRKIEGGTLENDQTALTLPVLKDALDQAAKDGGAFFKARGY